MQTVMIKVGGMTCEGCVRSVTNVLTRLPGVASAQVSLEQGVAQVSFDAQKIGVDRMRAAIEAAGYEATE
jgi:copper chaperone